jgi:hypothetical protein
MFRLKTRHHLTDTDLELAGFSNYSRLLFTGDSFRILRMLNSSIFYELYDTPLSSVPGVARSFPASEDGVMMPIEALIVKLHWQQFSSLLIEFL